MYDLQLPALTISPSALLLVLPLQRRMTVLSVAECTRSIIGTFATVIETLSHSAQGPFSGQKSCFQSVWKRLVPEEKCRWSAHPLYHLCAPKYCLSFVHPQHVCVHHILGTCVFHCARLKGSFILTCTHTS